MLSKCFVSAENETEKGTLIEKKSQTIHMLPKKNPEGPFGLLSSFASKFFWRKVSTKNTQLC